jgi:hypothetical protein
MFYQTPMDMKIKQQGIDSICLLKSKLFTNERHGRWTRQFQLPFFVSKNGMIKGV